MPSRQREVAVRLAHTRQRLAGGSKAWPTPDVCSWPAWLERCAEQARHGALRGQRRLGWGEEWLLWREAAEEACEGLGVMHPAGLADALRRASTLQDAWQLFGASTPASEYGVLQRARAAVARHCRLRQTYSASDWTAVLREAQPVQLPLLFAGFPPLGTALEARLRTLGASFVDAGAIPAPVAGGHRLCSAANADDELRLAAQWCRERLEQDSAARLLVVIPQLLEERAGAIQAFEHALHGAEAGRGEPLFALEGGQPLSSYPLIRAALGLLALASAPVTFSQAAALLRSPYLTCGTQAQRAALELLLRERNVHAVDFALLLELARNETRGPAAGCGAALQAISPAMSLPRGTRAGAGWWARRYVEMLEAMGWAGAETLGSAELQQQGRFRELLGELDRLGAGGGQLGPEQAHELLSALATRTAFEAESADVPVTLTASLDDPLVDYDGIWVAGMGAARWPPPPLPEPFLPILMQRERGLPAASPPGQLLEAQRAMAAWERCAGQLVYSWPEFDREVPLEPSSLLRPASPPVTDAAERPLAVPCPDRLVQAIHRSARRELRPLESGRAWPRERQLPGGTRSLQLQSLCPFRAVAELRLGAIRVPEPVPGLDRREHGQLLHLALELLWRELQGSRVLQVQSRDAQALSALVRSAVARALEARLVRRALPLAGALVEIEQRRLEAQIVALLQQDLERAEAAEFTVSQLEMTQDGELGGLPIRVRIDRIDRLDDGRFIVLDYKSGSARSFRPLDERPRQAQLLAYALLAPAPLAGVAAVYLPAEGIRWCGAAADPALLPALSRTRGPSAPFPELLAHWRKVIEMLAGEFAAGVAAVQPLAGACKECHLPGLCRIAAAKQPPPDPEIEGLPDDAV